MNKRCRPKPVRICCIRVYLCAIGFLRICGFVTLVSSCLGVFVFDSAQTVLAQEYTVNPGDTLSITVWEKDSLSGSIVVDANGYIALPPPIGGVKVIGLTASEISQLFTDRLEEYVRNPTVFVSVAPEQGFTVHVLGEVQTPNFYQVPEGTSIQEVITHAGGFTELADLKHIRLISKAKVRHAASLSKDSEQSEQLQERMINFSQFLENADLSQNPTLSPDDVLLVPRLSKVERAGQTVTVIGAVNNRGTFPLEEPLSLVEVLALAGWPSDGADERNISILNVSDEKNTWERVDLEGFLAGNTPSVNPKVSPSEIIFVPKTESEEVQKRTFSVNVVGQVKQAGIQPVTDGARLFDAIYMAGGFTDEAAIDRVTIIHAHPQSPTKVELNLKNYLMMGDLNENPQLAEGDTIFVPMSEDARTVPIIHTAFFKSIRVSIIGEVVSPNTYQISPESSVLDVLKLAGGATTDADLRRVTVIREQTEREQRLKVDLERVLTEGEFELMPHLQKDDNIFVPKLRPKREIWGTVVGAAADIATIAIAYYLVIGRGYYR